MRMIEISQDKFYDFAKKTEYDNYCQTSNYGEVLKKKGYEYNFVAYTTNDYEILACGMFLIKKIGTFYYAYSPKGFIIDYKNDELVRKFTRNLIKYYKKKNIILIKINPLIPISTVKYNNPDNTISNENSNILEYLKKLGYKKRKETKPYELLENRLTTIINLKEFDINKLSEETKNKIEISNNDLIITEEDGLKIDFLYNLSSSNKESLDYYKNIYNEFEKDKQIDLLMVKVNYEAFLINAKKRVEKEQINNDILNEQFKTDTNNALLEEKMKSDNLLEKYKQDVVLATQGLKNNNDNYIAGALVIKYNNKVNIILSNKNKDFNYLSPDYFLYYNIIEKYKDNFEFLDLNGISGDFTNTSDYYEDDKTKTDFNPIITEYIGELDLIVSNWKFKIAEKNYMLASEFNNTK